MKRAKGKGRKEKPTGRKELVLLGGGRPPEVRRVQWPEHKEEVEQLMLEGALRSPARRPPTLAELYQLEGPPERNPENDFDFTLPTGRGNEYLDLVEFAPLTRQRGSYEGGSAYHIRGQMADLLWETIATKARKYHSAATPLHLLAYSTDFRLDPGEGTLLLVALRASRERHPFTSIAHYSPDDLTSGDAFIIYPVECEKLETIDEQEMRNTQITRADLSGGVVTPAGGISIVTDYSPAQGRARISHVELEVPLPRAAQQPALEGQVGAPVDSSMSVPGPQRWARVQLQLARKQPGLPTFWVAVLDRHPDGVAAEPGYVWLDTPGKVLHARAQDLEFTERPLR